MTTAAHAQTDALRYGPLSVRMLHPTIGAEVHGIDIAGDLDDETIAALRRAWTAHKVIILRDQDVTDDRHVAFSRRLGDLEIFPQSANRASANPEIFRVANVSEDGALLPADDETVRYATTVHYWHTDSSYRPIPSMGAILHGIEVTSDGGDTLFADMEAAYEALPADKKERLKGLCARNSFEYMRWRRDLPTMKEAERVTVPPVEHPIVRTCSDTGRRSLYLSPAYIDKIDTLSVAESHALVDELVAWSTQARFVYRHRWRTHDVVMWDNRCTMHRVTPFDMARQRRVMHRTSIKGREPVL